MRASIKGVLWDTTDQEVSLDQLDDTGEKGFPPDDPTDMIIITGYWSIELRHVIIFYYRRLFTER